MSVVSLKDIAKYVGKDVSTVSLALRGDRRIKQATRMKIESVARKLGYRPNVMARAMQGARTYSIGLVIHSLSNPHTVPIVNGVHRVASQNKNVVLIQEISGGIYWGGNDGIGVLTDRAVDGLIIEPHPAETEKYLKLQRDNIPLVFVMLTCDKAKADTVISDDAFGSELAIKHLYSLGHRKIAMIHAAGDAGKNGDYERLSRYNGYLEIMKKLGLPSVAYGSDAYTIEDGYRLTRQLLKEHPETTAIYAVSETLAVGVSRAIKETGRKIPEDISLVGFEGGLRGESMDPPLTTLRCPMEAIGSAAAELLLKRIEGKSYHSIPQTVLFNPELIVRESTAPVKNK